MRSRVAKKFTRCSNRVSGVPKLSTFRGQSNNILLQPKPESCRLVAAASKSKRCRADQDRPQHFRRGGQATALAISTTVVNARLESNSVESRCRSTGATGVPTASAASVSWLHSISRKWFSKPSTKDRIQLNAHRYTSRRWPTAITSTVFVLSSITYNNR